MTSGFDRAYARRFPLFGSTPTPFVVKLESHLEGPSKVLDLGCGDGRDTLWLLDKGHEVEALDISSVAIHNLIRRAREMGFEDQLTARAADVRVVHWPEEAFDAAVAVTLLDHLDQPEVLPLVRRVRSSIRGRGLVAFEMHSNRDPGLNPEGNPGAVPSEFAEEVRFYSPSNFLLKVVADWRVMEYSDRLEEDHDHGPSHRHGFVSIIARREDDGV